MLLTVCFLCCEFSEFRSGYGKQVPVIFEIDQNVSERIITDEEWLWQMILNLLTNACKYTDRGEIRVVLSRQNGTADSTFMNEDEMLLIEVMDTGIPLLLNWAPALQF